VHNVQISFHSVNRSHFCFTLVPEIKHCRVVASPPHVCDAFRGYRLQYITFLFLKNRKNYMDFRK